MSNSHGEDAAGDDVGRIWLYRDGRRAFQAYPDQLVSKTLLPLVEAYRDWASVVGMLVEHPQIVSIFSASLQVGANGD